NRGNGSFQSKLDYRTGAGPQSLATGDLNGDGRLDLVTAGVVDRDSGTVSVLLNKPGLCTVQDVMGQTLAAAKRTIAHANCRAGHEDATRGGPRPWRPPRSRPTGAGQAHRSLERQTLCRNVS